MAEIPDEAACLKFLFDTNVLIRAEPTSPDDVEQGTPVVADLLRLINEGSHQPYVHPASIEELRGDRDLRRREMREILVRKYPQLPSPPPVTAALAAELPRPAPGSHDETDHVVLAAVRADAVDYLVTDDQKLIQKARRVGLGSRVLTPTDAVTTLRGLFRTVPLPPPAVYQVVAHQLVEEDPIFASLSEDYPGFNLWLRKCKREHRLAWTIPRDTGHLAGVCIVKEERDREHGLPGRLLKLCTLKIAEDARGYRYGELLLKAVFTYAFENSFDQVYVEVFERHGETIDLLESFGFQQLPARTPKGELVLAKPLKYSQRDIGSFDELAFHIRFGPRYLKAKDVFVVPIQPAFHDMLFPECAHQRSLFESVGPYGNSILKAYLCNAKTRQITAGSVLLFYESGGSGSVRCLGVVEETLVSERPEEIAHFVGQRTVYSFSDISEMCRSPVLAILFRQASGVIVEPISLKELERSGALKGPPQSITRVKEDALTWIREQIELSP